MTVIINGSTGITNVNGTASAPAETGADTDTGIFYGTNTVSLATNGTTALSIDASQNTTLAGTLTLGTATQAIPSGTAPLYAARAWVNFNGTGTVAIRASGNVTSITDNGVGQYTVNLTAAMPDANYSIGINTDYDGVSYSVNAKTFATTSFLIQCILPNLSNYADKSIVNAQIFR